MAFSLGYFGLFDKRVYYINNDFYPFQGKNTKYVNWEGTLNGFTGEFQISCDSCMYDNVTVNWEDSNTTFKFRGYGDYVIVYKLSVLYKNSNKSFGYTLNRTITLKENPSISGIDNVIQDKRKGFNIDFTVTDTTPNAKLSVRVNLDDKVIQTFNNISSNSNLTAIVTDEQINYLPPHTTHELKITLNDGYDDFYRKYAFWKIPKGINISTSSVTSSQSKFIVTKTYSELAKIEWYLDSVLKETFTTELYSEKTINYTLGDNAIHTLKIIATDTDSITVEKVVSVSKNIMPVGDGASLQDIATKVSEMKDGLINGKTSIINVLALKNIESSLNNTLVELSEKVKTSFDSSDASAQELQNRITELNNQLSQRKKWATGIYTLTQNDVDNFVAKVGKLSYLTVQTNLNFTPSIIVVRGIKLKKTVSVFIDFSDVTNFGNFGTTGHYYFAGHHYYDFCIKFENFSSNSFQLRLSDTEGLKGDGITSVCVLGDKFTWYAYE